jgi:6-phosphogluconolactonase
MAAQPDWHIFETRDKLAEAFATTIAETLQQAVAQRGTGFIAVSGGTTPAGFFRSLSNKEIDWKKVVVTLIDERFVPETSDRSNAALAHRTLLQNRAAQARFVPLYHTASTIEEGAEKASQVLKDLPWPLDVAILGMGGDGHTASFFPDATTLATLLEPSQTAFVLPVHAKSAGEPRLTLPLARIEAAGRTAVHIEGTDKKVVLEAALEPTANRPISAVFRQGRKPVEIYWAP